MQRVDSLINIYLLIYLQQILHLLLQAHNCNCSGLQVLTGEQTVRQTKIHNTHLFILISKEQEEGA